MFSRGSWIAWVLWGVVLLAMPGVVVAANPPALTNYQGVLRGPADEPLTGTFDMVFRFFDAETAGNEILIDRHMTLNAAPVMVDGGLFSVALGGGLVVDGGGPGSFTSLTDVFRDHTEVWLEMQIGAETLTPRTRVLATGYALNAATAATAGTAAVCTTATTASTATNATQLDGQPATFYLNTSATRQVKDGAVRFTTADPSAYVVEAIASSGSPGGLYAQGTNAFCLLARPNSGAQCGGNTYGGYFYDANENAYGYVGYNVYGLYSVGPTYGAYSLATGSTGTGVFAQAPQYGIYSNATANAGVGIYGSAYLTAAHFTQPSIPNTYTKIAYSGYGLLSHSYHGLHQWDENDGGYARVGAMPYKIEGNGTVSFVQNHPDDPNKVVTYHAPESSEVNVYTRGSARLEKGAARVALDPTFAWVANPDLGLTAHLTPRGEPVPLAVESVTSRELVVRGPAGSEVVFDFWVTGLRIGFEEMAPVKPKEFESAIPRNASMTDLYAADPELRPFNALERYRVIEHQVGRAVDPELRASAALRNRIGLSHPTQVPNEALVLADAANPANAANPITPPVETAAAPPAGPSAHAPQPVGDDRLAGAYERPAELVEARDESRRLASERFPASSSIDAGDVVVIDPEVSGAVRRCDRQDDRTVVGIALSAAHGGWVEVAMGSVAVVRADAAYGAVRAGDLLVSSPAAGAAMRAATAEPGTILGKALEPLESGLGMIRVLVMLR
jgi:hypothetical protein